MKERNYTLMSGFSRMFNSNAHVEMKRYLFTIERDDEFKKLMSNSLKTDNGFTIGQRNRAFLHAVLDAWIDDSELDESLNATDEQCARFNGACK
jgi:hypothetical protein